jgi:release factor glutamine methyltransferase
MAISLYCHIYDFDIYAIDREKSNISLNILDLGTGSGCLLISLLKEFPNSKGVGIDINRETLKIATLNSIEHNLSNRIQFIQSNWFENINEMFDLIVSNPPYIAENEINFIDPIVKDWEPKEALFGGKDGLESYRQIASGMKIYLDKMIKKNSNFHGNLLLEIGKDQGEKVKEIFLQIPALKYKTSKKDYDSIERCLVFQW